MAFTSTFAVIYCKIVATTFGAKVDEGSSQREKEREREREKEKGRERWSGEPLSESDSRLKTPKDSVIYHGRPPAGMKREKGYNPPDRLIAD